MEVLPLFDYMAPLTVSVSLLIKGMVFEPVRSGMEYVHFTFNVVSRFRKVLFLKFCSDISVVYRNFTDFKVKSKENSACTATRVFSLA